MGIAAVGSGSQAEARENVGAAIAEVVEGKAVHDEPWRLSQSAL
jgi:hypothetical protein